jgi:DNA polymerase-3 subunit gamma/tau
VRPARDRYKVFIIDEVHMLSGAAFNALLKTLEEPPPRVLFIMATTEAHKLPDTILSRCQQFEFRTISSAKIAERLKLIAKAEKIKVADDALREIARAGEGSMRDAQSAFDQVISFSEGKIEVADVENALGMAGGEMLARVMRAVAGQAPAEALSVVEELVSRGHELRNFCRDLLAHVRDLLVLKAAGEATALADAGEAERRALVEESKDFSESDLVRFFHSLTETERHLRESAHPRYQLEIGLVKLIEMRRLAPLGQILERLGALEEALRTGRAPATTAAGGPPTPTTAPPSGAGGGHTRRGAGSGGASSSSAFSATQPDGAPAPPTPQQQREAYEHASAATFARAQEPARASTPPQSAPVDLSDLLTGGFATEAARQSAPPAHANLKLVPPAAETGAPVSAGSLADDEPPFPVDGAVRAPSAYVNTAAPSSAPPAFDARLAQRDGGAQSFAGAAHPSPAGDGARAASSGGDALERIKRVLDARRKPFLAVAIDEARTARVDGDELFIAFTPDRKHLRDMLNKPDNVRLIQDVCRETLGRDVGVRIVVREADEGEEEVPLTKEDVERRERQRLRELAEQQPAVQEMLRAFRAEIVDVRRADGEARKEAVSD